MKPNSDKSRLIVRYVSDADLTLNINRDIISNCKSEKLLSVTKD